MNFTDKIYAEFTALWKDGPYVCNMIYSDACDVVGHKTLRVGTRNFADVDKTLQMNISLRIRPYR